MKLITVHTFVYCTSVYQINQFPWRVSEERWARRYLYWSWSSAAPSQRPHGRAASPADTESSAFPSLFPEEQHTHTHTHRTGITCIHFIVMKVMGHRVSSSLYFSSSVRRISAWVSVPQTSFLSRLPLRPPHHPPHSSEDTKVNIQSSFFSCYYMHESLQQVLCAKKWFKGRSTFAIMSA